MMIVFEKFVFTSCVLLIKVGPVAEKLEENKIKMFRSRFEKE